MNCMVSGSQAKSGIVVKPVYATTKIKLLDKASRNEEDGLKIIHRILHFHTKRTFMNKVELNQFCENSGLYLQSMF